MMQRKIRIIYLLLGTLDMNFLIIGGAGFIGYHLAYNLSINKNIISI